MRVKSANVVGQKSGHLSANCDWEQKHDVWVPTEIRFSERWSEKEGLVRLDWHTVNDCCETNEITLEGSVLPDRLVVSDRRVTGGPPLTLGKLGDLRAGAKRPPVVDPAKPRVGRRGIYVWVLNLVVLIGIAGWWGWRTIQRRAGPG